METGETAKAEAAILAGLKFCERCGGSIPEKMFHDGHALHAELKPNRVLSDAGYRTWGESFGDQMAMWTSLRDWDRALRLLAETNGNLNQSNAHFYYPPFLWRNGEKVEIPENDRKGRRGKYSHDLMTAEALGFLNEVIDRVRAGEF